MIDFLICLFSEKRMNWCLRELRNWLELKFFLTCVSVICSSSASLCLSLEPRYFCRSNTRSNCKTCSTEKDERLLLDRADREGPWSATSKQRKHKKFSLKLFSEMRLARMSRVFSQVPRARGPGFWRYGRFSSSLIIKCKHLLLFF